MKRLLLILCACALVMAASTQAQARYQILRWSSGFCQIWDSSTPWKPFPSDYKTGVRPFRTFEAAAAMRSKLIARRQCSW